MRPWQKLLGIGGIRTIAIKALLTSSVASLNKEWQRNLFVHKAGQAQC